MSVEANALSSTVDCIAAIAINAMVQTTLHLLFQVINYFSDISY